MSIAILDNFQVKNMYRWEVFAKHELYCTLKLVFYTLLEYIPSVDLGGCLPV